MTPEQMREAAAKVGEMSNTRQCEARKLPWYAIKTTRFAGSGLTTISPIWQIRRWPTHAVNIFTQIRGWYWIKKGY